MNLKKTEKFIIEIEDANQRIDAFLSNLYFDLSRSFIQKQIKVGNVLLNGELVKASQIIKVEDAIDVSFENANEIEIEPENIGLDIVYEDSTMLVVNKPKGMLTHPTSIEKTGTLVNALLFKYKDTLSDCNGKNRPGIVHRLDRNTSGLLMIAKTNDAYEKLKAQMQARTVEKKYYAIVCGDVKDDLSTIETNMGRHPTRPEKMAVTQDGKHAVTHYKVLERLNGYTLLEICIETGRTHQIRVHMAYINNPIVNDTMYGGAKLPVKTQEQVLQAFSLKFISPSDNKEKHILIGHDNDIIKTLNYLRSKR